jgi:hypothetical protein
MTILEINTLIIINKQKWLITGVITACYSNTLKPKALPREARGRTGLVRFPLAQFSETDKAGRRGRFC